MPLISGANVAPPVGEIYLTAAATMTITDTTTYFVLDNAANTALGSVSRLFDKPSNSRLRYTGTNPAILHIAMSVSFTTDSNSQIIRFVIQKNGATITGSEQQRKTGTGTDVGSTAIHASVAVVTNDYLTIGIRNGSSASDASIVNMNLFAMAMPA